MDGKHIVIQKPAFSGSMFYTYKRTFAIQLLAVVDANYRFIYVDVGVQGRIGDAGVFLNSSLCEAMTRELLNIPKPEPLSNSSPEAVPYVFIADEAFPLKTNILKPYASRGLDLQERSFNYRLSRGRRIVENAFGILASRFRVFHTNIALNPSKVQDIVLAATVLHNLLRQLSPATYSPPTWFDTEDTDSGTIAPAEWRRQTNTRGLLDINSCPPNQRKLATDAKHVRDIFKRYFMNEGQVPWQWKMVTR